ncbi:MAG: hypothetical protein MI673_05650, partial [Thiotrichales bacterium]|nr:hypothetical protein [Thiotrichales bacterium]
MLTTTDHSRDVAGLRYVYPVISRRSRGLSIGINLNPNNACNWRCIYCQVPGLVRGAAPETDVGQLDQELRGMLDDISDLSFQKKYGIEADLASISDFAISGNGEPTTCREFDQVIDCLSRIICDYSFNTGMQPVLITNGSQVHQQHVQDGLRHLQSLGGEVWFKLDSASDAGLRRINHAGIGIARVRDNLIQCSELCPTWIQSCFFTYQGAAPAEQEIETWLGFIEDLVRQGTRLRGVQLYGIERRPMQAESGELGKVELDWLQCL